MAIYSDYLSSGMDFNSICSERKKQLQKISEIRGNRDIIVYASDLGKGSPFNQIDYSDILPFHDQLTNLNGENIDIIIETPGGIAEVVEDFVRIIRSKYEKVGIIIPGYAKSAGTIFAMAGDEILMGSISALGPIDAQIISNNKHFSAEAFLEGLEKIKSEVLQSKRLNPAYIPILQNISPGEIQHCENAQQFSQKLVYEWLAKYKFKYWETHSSTGEPVTEADKIQRAKEIAGELCKHSSWLTHGRSIRLEDCERMRLKIFDYSKNSELNEAITRYYTLLRMSFETNLYKIIETVNSQIYRFMISGSQQVPIETNKKIVSIAYNCPKCNNKSLIQVNFDKGTPLQPDHIPYPIKDNILKCPQCGTENNLSPIRLQIEAQENRKIIE